jgi:hypothetical protein
LKTGLLMVALTGIEWVSAQFGAAQPNLNCLFSIELIPPEAQLDLCGMPWCDRGVTPAPQEVR